MLLKTPKGNFLLEKNFRDAYKEEAFLDKYLEEVFDKDLYIVGDISNGILRLKGFDSIPNSPNHYSLLSKYLETSTVIGCPYYILKRIRTNEEFEKLSHDEEKSKTDETGFTITSITKENFDKESLKLQSSHKDKPNIVLDSQKFNSIPKGSLPSDLKENNEKSSKESAKPIEDQQTYVSSSPDFDPSKKEVRNKGNRPNNNNNQKNNNNNNNNNNNGNNNNNSNNNNNNFKNNRNHRRKNRGFKPRNNGNE